MIGAEKATFLQDWLELDSTLTDAMSRLPLHALTGFAAAARSGNLTRAAASQHLTVSALSHQVRQLEERLGQRLFERGPRGVKLTADGERLLARIGPHLDALEV